MLVDIECVMNLRTSAFAGMAVMVLLFPLPGWVASKVQTIQVEKMKKTDIRVQSVTECGQFLQRHMVDIRLIVFLSYECHPHDQTLRLGAACQATAHRETRG